MPVPPRPISPEQFAEGRRLYEQTRMPVDDIARMMGIGTRTFYTRVRSWGWQRRGSRIPRLDPSRSAPEEAPASRSQQASTDLPLAARIERLVEHELAAIEKIMRRRGPDESRSEEMDRSARVLASLARTLQEMKRLDSQDTRHQDENDRGPDDPDEFARELLRQLDEFVARGKKPFPDGADGGNS
jgi:hypothetical protein